MVLYTRKIHGETSNFYWHGNKNYGLHPPDISRKTVYFTGIHAAIIAHTSVIFLMSP